MTNPTPKHATVTRDGYEVPLIGVPADAVLDLCDLCHDWFPIRELEVTDAGLLCRRCREAS